MYLEVYPDIIFVLNFIIDLILLILLKKINQKMSSLMRLLGAAAVGAVFAVIIGIYPQMNVVIRFLLMNLVATFLMVFVAFGKLKKMDLLKQMLVLYLITYFAGGFVNSLYYHTDFRPLLQKLKKTYIVSNNISWKFVIIVMLILLPVSIFILWMLRLYKSNEQKTYEVALFLDNRSIHTRGLMDTGNCLYDPIFRKPVIIIENALLDELLSQNLRLEFYRAKEYMEGEAFLTDASDLGSNSKLRLRVIPYTSIGKAQGTMLGLVLDKILIYKGKETICNEKVTAAICDNLLSTKEEYHVILHKELI